MDFGNDAVMYEKDNFILLGIHNSNNPEKFINQWTNIKNFVNSKNTYTVLICGDFNANYVKNNKTLTFLNKENNSHLFSLDFESLFLVSTFICTSFKIRCLTTQFNKINKKISSSIDGFILFSPKIDDFTYTSSFVDNDFPPENWFSDHAYITCQFNNISVISCNIMGESTNFNIYEMFTKSSYNLFQNYDQLYKDIPKEFFEDIKFNTYGKKFEICNIFLPPNSPKINTNSPFYNNLKEKYDQANLYFLINANEEEFIYVNKILDVYNNFLEHHILKNFFVEWYLEVEKQNKIKRIDFISNILLTSRPTFFYLCEVNLDVYDQIIELNNLDYTIISSEFKKTGGIIFSRK